jgi:7-cyano-7-deazaguanine synthase
MTPADASGGLRPLLSVKEVANTLRISASGVYRLIESGALQRLKVGNRTLFERAEVERYIATQRAAATGASGGDGHNAPAGRPAVVLLSGGLDSTTTLAMASSEGYRVHAISFRYGQRHAVELDAAREIADAAGIEKHVIVDIDLRLFGGSALTADVEVPKDRSTGEMEHGIPITYVPARNTVFLSFGLAWAEVLDADDLFLGVNALDYSGYPDCRPEYVAAFERMANLATKRAVEGHRLRIHTPLIGLTKAQIIRCGLDLGVDYSLTRSCYDPSDSGDACGRCDSCSLRLKGFAENGVADPAPYQVEPAAA